MNFEWDDDKQLSNLAEHGLDFEQAALVFLGPTFEFGDTRHDYGEERTIAVGYAEGECIVVVFTRRDDAIRIISARRGGRRDKRKYHAHFA